jgi:hypothetical protein
MRQIAFPTQNLGKNLKRKAEIDILHRTNGLMREVLDIYTASVRRVHEAGLMRGKLSVDQTAAMLWASLSGVFMLADQPLFRDAMGASQGSFIDRAVDFQLGTDSAAIEGPTGVASASRSIKNGSDASARTGRGKAKDLQTERATISSTV